MVVCKLVNFRGDKSIEVKQQQINAQVAEIYDDNPYNNKIKSVI